MNKHYTYSEWLKENNTYEDTYKKYLELQKELDKYMYIVAEIKESCRSVIGNQEHTIVSKNELMRIMLKEVEKMENEE